LWAEWLNLLSEIREWLGPARVERRSGISGAGYRQALIGVVTRRDLLDKTISDSDIVAILIRRPPAVVFDDSSLREAADHMVTQQVDESGCDA